MSEIKDTYFSISSRTEALYKEKGSKFYAYAFPISGIEEVESNLELLKDKHPKARHFCYAYQLGIDGHEFRVNDDGEPSGTAGKPIYGQIQSFELSDILIVVVRYFGGTKLGASGLIQAYKESSRAALEQAQIIKMQLSRLFLMQSDYEQMPLLLEALKHSNINIVDKAFSNQANIQIKIPLSQIDMAWKQIATNFIGHDANLEDIKPIFQIETLKKIC